MVLDSNPYPNSNSEHIDPHCTSKTSNPNSPSEPQDIKFCSLLENPKPSFQGKGKGVAMSSASSPPPILYEFFPLKRENSENLEPEELENKIKMEPLNNSFPLNADLDRKVWNPPLATIAEMTTYSEEFSFSQFLHDQNCSLTKGSKESNSVDPMWNAEEGTVYGKFRPHGFIFANLSSEVKNFNGNKIDNVNNNGGGSSDNELIYPLELPAIMCKTVAAAPSSDEGDIRLRSESIFKEIVCESIPFTKQVLEKFNSKLLNELKINLKSLMENAEKKDKFVRLQRRLEMRHDLTEETLARANRVQLEIMVAIKTGVIDFLTIKGMIPSNELVQIFMMTRCKNLDCKLLIPADDCDCEICSRGIGFCRECMCVVCRKFDCATNTCTWVGCWMCNHWCHALCAHENGLFKPGLNQKVNNGATEIQFMCPACTCASEIYGFMKDVFITCGKNWGLDTLMKELDCVRMIFHLSEDPEGKELEKMAIKMLTKLGKKKITAADACEAMLKFFNYGVSDHSVMGISTKGSPPAAFLAGPKIKPLIREPIPTPILNYNDQEIQTLETNIRLKEAEANLLQRLADEARNEAEGHAMILQAMKEKRKTEHASSFAEMVHLQGDHGNKRRKFEGAKFAEGSHSGYRKMEGDRGHVARMRNRR